MPVRMLRAARQELIDAIEYYDRERTDLGDEFLDEFVRAVERIRAWPKAWAQISRRSRRCRLNRFPYSVVYQIRGDEILLLAVAHAAMKPGYWKKRERS